MRILPTISVFALFAAACSSPPAVIPTKNLEHPSDMTFVCVGEVDLDGKAVLSGQPMAVCHNRDKADPLVNLDGPRNLGTFAFVANPGRNEVAIADMDRGRLLDLTPASAGYGMLPVGGTPESIASSQDGCWVVTANRTSCDFTMLDPARLLAPTFSSGSTVATPATETGDSVRRVSVETGTSHRILRASAGEIAFLPGQSSTGRCESSASSLAVATFPGCDMVALLKFSFGEATAKEATATIVSAYFVRPDLPGGFQSAGDEPVCPSDCGLVADSQVLDGGMGTAGGADGGAAGTPALDAGTVAPGSSYYLQPLALVPDGTRVYVGSLRDTAITSLDIGAAGMSNPTRLSLAENPVGVTRLRLAIDPYRAATAVNADGTAGGPFLANRGKFLYAIARDDSIRVLDVGPPVPVECDANIITTDRSVTSPAQGCFPVGSKPRRPLALGPGIRIPPDLPSSNPDNPPPLPRDISFAELVAPAGVNVHSLQGQFGFVVASNGKVYVLNLAPTGEDASFVGYDGNTLVPPTATHSFREARDVGKTSRTPLSLSIAPQRDVIVSDQAFPTTATFSALDGPLLRSFTAGNDSTTSWLDYPDPNTIISRSWRVIWEGALPLATRSSGQVAPGLLNDQGADFCASDVHPGDVLMFSGCTQNSDCQPDDQFTCQVAVSGARGMCLPVEANARANLIQACGRFMGSRMRYEIAQATSTALALQLKVDEVPKTTLNPCQADNECWPDVDHGSLVGSSPDGGVGAGKAFSCVEVRPQDRRCVKRCKLDSDCRTGHVCAQVPWATASADKLCVEAPPLDPGCFPPPMMASYSVRAGHSFMVYGGSMPAMSSLRKAADGTCQPLPPSDPSLVARIPLSAPKCPDSFLAQAHSAPVDETTKLPTGPAVFVQDLSAMAGFDPCLYQGLQTDVTAASAAPGADDGHIRAFFQNPQIRFVLTNLDQYAGDLLSLHFELQYGFVPLTVQIPSYEVLLTMGTRVLTGPLQTPESPIRHATLGTSYPYLYVVDQGRTALTPGSRGQVLRINPRSGGNELASFDTTLSGSTPFQLQ